MFRINFPLILIFSRPNSISVDEDKLFEILAHDATIQFLFTEPKRCILALYWKNIF